MKLLAGLLLAPAFVLSAQDRFEVATVKPNLSGGPGGSMRSYPGGRFEAVNSTAQSLIRYAFNVKDFQIAGAPGWLNDARWDVTAKATGLATTPQFRVMVQNLLADQFGLVVHRETREGPVYVLTVAKGGPKLKKSKEDSTTVASGASEIVAHKLTLVMLAGQISNFLDRPVMNRTELEGAYDVTLRWTDEAPGPSLFTALDEQLGLRLVVQKGPVETLVIDRISRKPGPGLTAKLLNRKPKETEGPLIYNFSAAPSVFFGS